MTDQPSQYWSESPGSLLAALHSTAEGLSTDDAQQRPEQFGPNVLKAREKATALGLFLNQFKSPIVLILLFATGVSAVLGEWVDALIILAIVLGSAVLSFWQEYSANTAAEKLRAQVTIKATVLRDGQPRGSCNWMERWMCRDSSLTTFFVTPGAPTDRPGPLSPPLARGIRPAFRGRGRAAPPAGRDGGSRGQGTVGR